MHANFSRVNSFSSFFSVCVCLYSVSRHICNSIYTLSARPKLLKWIWFDDVKLLILLVLLFKLGLFILLLLAFNLNLFVLEWLAIVVAMVDGVVNDDAGSDIFDAGEKWYAAFCTEVQLPSSFDFMNNGCSMPRPLSQPPKFILSQWPLFGNRFRRIVPAQKWVWIKWNNQYIVFFLLLKIGIFFKFMVLTGGYLNKNWFSASKKYWNLISSWILWTQMWLILRVHFEK